MSEKTDLNQILYFVTVVESGSYTKAAERLGIPKSTLSLNIQALEEKLNLRLLNRSTRKLSLTKAGENYFESCAPLMAQLQKAQAEILDYQQDIKGHLKLTTAVEFGLNFLADILPEFIDRYPKIKLEINFSTDNLDLVEEGFDLAIRINKKLKDSSYIAKRIATPKLGLYATPKYLESHSAIKKLDDLNQHEHIIASISKSHIHIENQGPFLREKIALSTNSMFFNKVMCLKDMGVALLPTVLCLQELKQGLLTPVLPDIALESPHIYAVYPSRNHPSKALKTFIEFIEQEIKKAEGMH